MKNYKQCNLLQNQLNTVGWIEERGARVGAFVEIDELGGLWEVTAVSSTVMTQAEVREKQRMNRGSLLSIKP